MTIVIAGGSGFIGTQLSKKLVSEGHTVIVVDVVPPSFTHETLFFINCDISQSPLPYGILEKVDAVINLAGVSIVGKWTPEYKESIAQSRFESTKHIVEGIRNASSKPSCFICASAIGFYGDTGNEVVDERTVKGEGFLSDVVARWEEIAHEAETYGVRVVSVRTAPVLGRGGLLKELLKTARFGFLLSLKKESFWMSWIHEEDIIRTYLFALETTTVQGVFNASAPESVEHHVFMKTLSHAVHRRVIGALPRFVAKKLFGSLFFEITKSQRVAPQRLIDKGFVFSYPTITSAMHNIFKK